MIVLRSVCKEYDCIKAVQDLSLTIEDKEIFGLLGPNGAGKTTTILMLSTILKPTRGDIIVNSYSIISNADKVRQCIGISFQEPVLDPRLTVEHNLDFHAEACGMPGSLRRERIRTELEHFDLWNDRNKKIGKISGGMKRKVEDIKLFITKPKVAVFDEPTAYLDPPSKHKVWDRIREMREGGSTVILATNQMDEADELTDRVAIINRGKLVVVDTPSQLKCTLPSGEIVQFKMKDASSNVEELLRRLPVVKNVTVPKVGTVHVYVNQAKKDVPMILNALFEHKLDVTEMDIKKPNLDDVFMFYTGEVL